MEILTWTANLYLFCRSVWMVVDYWRKQLKAWRLEKQSLQLCIWEWFTLRDSVQLVWKWTDSKKKLKAHLPLLIKNSNTDKLSPQFSVSPQHQGQQKPDKWLWNRMPNKKKNVAIASIITLFQWCCLGRHMSIEDKWDWQGRDFFLLHNGLRSICVAGRIDVII